MYLKVQTAFKRSKTEAEIETRLKRKCSRKCSSNNSSKAVYIMHAVIWLSWQMS